MYSNDDKFPDVYIAFKLCMLLLAKRSLCNDAWSGVKQGTPWSLLLFKLMSRN